MSLQSRQRLNLALTAVVAALALLAYFRPGAKPADTQQPLLAFPTAGVSDIRLTPAGGTTTELRREAAHWRLTAPFAYPADANLVQAFLDSLSAAHATPVAGASPDLNRYGLDKPLVQLTIDGHALAFGGGEPVGDARYVLVDGRVELVQPLVFYQASHEVYWWLDKRLLPQDARITAMQLPKATLMLQGKRWLLSPKDDTVSADAIQKLIDDWQDASAIGLAPVGKAAPQGEVAVAISGVEKPLRFEILKDPDYLVLARPDLNLEYQFDNVQGQKLMEFAKPAPAASTLN